MFRVVELRAFCHATEDEERVAKAIGTVSPGAAIERESFEGHHGNPVVLLIARIERPDEIIEFWRRCRDSGALASILEDLPQRIDDEGILHFRFDKQQAYLGRLELARHDDVVVGRARITAHPAKKPDLVRAARDALAKV